MVLSTSHAQLVCPSCNAMLPEERREFPWCECGWNLPTDPLNELRGWRLSVGRMGRALGHLQDRLDARWILKNPTASLSWIALNGLMHSIGLLFIAGSVVLYIVLVGLAVFGILAFPQNCLLALLPLGISLPLLYAWRPYRAWIPKKARNAPEFHERVLDTARGVAERLGTAGPTAVTFSPWPVIHAGAMFRLTPLPHFERFVVVGVPMLYSLTVTEVKVLLGHAMLNTSSLKGILLPGIGKVLQYIWRIFDRLSGNFFGLLLSLVLLAVPLGCIMYAPWFMFGLVSPGAYVANIFLQFGALLLGILVITASLIWPAATWYRRSLLLADKTIARSFGRNALLQALSKYRLVNRTFARQWAGLSSDAGWGKLPDANLYTAFQRMWNSLSPAYKERSLREVAIDYPTFIYFEPTLKSRAELVQAISNQLTDDRPADTLVPSIGEIGQELTRTMFG